MRLGGVDAYALLLYLAAAVATSVSASVAASATIHTMTPHAATVAATEVRQQKGVVGE